MVRIRYSTSSNKGSLNIIPSGTVAKEEFNRDLNYVDLTELTDEENENSEMMKKHEDLLIKM